MKVKLTNLIQIFINCSTSTRILNKARIETYKSDNTAFLEKEYIPFVLVISSGSIELIAENYQIYTDFTNAINDIIQNKSIISNILNKIQQ